MAFLVCLSSLNNILLHRALGVQFSLALHSWLRLILVLRLNRLICFFYALYWTQQRRWLILENKLVYVVIKVRRVRPRALSELWGIELRLVSRWEVRRNHTLLQHKRLG